jgi:hypothetical protein
MHARTKKNFAKTLGYTCFTMVLVMAIWKGDLDRGMSVPNLLIALVLGYVGLISLTYEPSSGAPQTAAKVASPSRHP